MIEVSDIRVGLLVWWTANRDFSSWSCPCIVTEVNEDTFGVKSFDDFEETNSLRMHDIPGGDPTSRYEMQVSNLKEIKRFFEDRKRTLEDQVTDARRDLEDAQKELSSYQQKTEMALVELESVVSK